MTRTLVTTQILINLRASMTFTTELELVVLALEKLAKIELIIPKKPGMI